MSTHVMLTLDVERKATDEQRADFYDALKENHWKKLAGVTTTWSAIYTGEDIEAIRAHAITELRAFARAAGVVFDAVIQIGNSAPVRFASRVPTLGLSARA